jgi:L-threonylcarbamoyladenylate synthase
LPSRFRIALAARIVRGGGVIAYPTEAVYGVGCLPDHPAAVRRVQAVKRRPTHKGLLLVGADWAQLERFVVLPPEPRRGEVLATWPGPVTWVLEARPGAARYIGAARGTIAVRVTAHPPTQALCRAAGSALVSTSANLAGRRPARSALGVRRALGRRVDYVLAGPLGGLAKPTSIRDGRTGAVLRAG